MYHKNIAFHIFLFFLIFKSQVSATSFNEVADFQNTLVNILKKTILIAEDQNKEIDISFEIFSQPKIIRWCSNQEKILSLINDSNLSEFKTILQAPVLKICKGLNFLAAKKIPEDIKNKIDQNEDLSEQEEHNLRKIKFNSLEEKLVLSSFKKIKSKILEVRINKIPEVASLQSGEEGIDLSQASKPIQAYFRLILNEYFDSWDSENKVKLILDMLSLPKGASSESRLLLILNHCGPILQKTFQLFSRDSKSELLVKVLQNLKENIKPFDTELAKDIVSKYLEGPLSLYFENFPNYPIASATIGQVYIIPLVDSPVCLVSGDNDPSAHMQKMLEKMGQKMPATKRVLEINPDHPIFEKMLTFSSDKQDLWAEVLYNQALLNEGSNLKDPIKFSKQIAQIMMS